MKKRILLLLCLPISIVLHAQTLSISTDGKTASITGSTGGCLVGTTVLSAAQKTSITNLTITGTIDASDFKVMRDNMTALADVDLSGATIAAYTGTAGTISTASQTYAAATVPNYSFGTSSTGKTTLKTVKLPTSTTTIGSYVFQFCSNMTSLTIPAAVTSIGTNSLYQCSAIVTVDPANTKFASDAYGVVYGLTSGLKTSIYSAPTATSLNTVDYVVPSGVTLIGGYAFAYTNFKSITLSSTVTTINSNAFDSSNALTISIPAATTTINVYAFIRCAAVVSIDAANTKFASDLTYGIIYGLTSGVKTSIFQASTSTAFSTIDYTVPNTVTSIGAYAFHKNNLHSLTETSVTTIGANAFDSNNIPTININSAVTSFGNYALQNSTTTTVDLTGVVSITGNSVFSNSKVSSITLSNSLTTIGGGTFAGLSYLPSITIPSSVTSIGANPFYNSITTINVDAANTSYSSDSYGVLYNKTQTTLIDVPTSLTGNYVIPNSVTTIAINAFYYSKLTSITIPASVTNIGATAFQNASTANLTQIHVQGTTPASITLGSTIFSGLSASKLAIYVPDMVTATLYAAATQWLSYPIVREQPLVVNVTTAGTLSSLLTTGEKTYATALTITGTINAVDIKTLYSITKLTTLDLSGVTAIEAYTGTAGPVATSTIYPANEFPQYSFNTKTSLTSLVLPTCITSIGQYALKGTTGLTTLTIPNSVTTIGIYALNGCTGLTSLHLPDNLTSITSYMLYGCAALTTLNIPTAITSVDTYALYGCAKLTTLELPGTLKTIGTYAFSTCTLLTTINLPSSLTSIGAYAFSGCSALKSIAIPANITALNGYTFQGCSSLASVSFDASSALTTMGANDFANCSALTSLKIPDAVQTLNASNFINCTSLNTVTLPGKLKTFSAGIFSGCSSLDSVYLNTNNLYYSELDGVLYNKAKTVLTFCPMGRSGVYTILPTVKTIASYAFSNCTGITAINFGTSRPEILEAYAFQNCTGLTTITIPSSVASFQNSVNGSVFQGCTNLVINFETGSNYLIVDGVTFTADMKTLVSCPSTKTGNYAIPDGVVSIQDAAFAASSLTSVVMPSSLTTLGQWSFLGATQLTSVSLSSNITKIPWQCFFGCPLLKSIVIPAGVTEIETSAFYNDYQLRSVTLPEGLTRIGHYAFQNCPIVSIVLPKSLKSVGVGSFGEDFLLSVEFPKGFERFDGDGVFWNQVRTLKMNNPEPIDITTALNFANSTLKTNAALIVPAGSKAKYQAAPGWADFKNIIEDGSAADLTVTSTAGGLSAAIRTLGYSILNVKKLTVLGNINAIDIKMMRDSMLVLSDINLSGATIDAIATATTLGTISSSVTYAANTLPQYAFYNCKRVINNLVLPNNLVTVDNIAFQSARGIKSVYIPATVSTLNGPLTYDNFIKYTVDPASTYFYSDSVAIYNTAKTTLVAASNAATGSYTILPTVTTLTGYAFYGSQLTSIGLPPSITSTGYYVFSGCTALTYTSYGTTPVGVNGYTFYYINSASKLYVPTGTKSLYMTQTTWSSNFGTSRIIEMASVTKTIAAGTLATSLTSTEKAGLVKLKLTGEMDARDFKFIRDSLPLLTSLDISAISIVALNNSTEGTAGTTATNYPANMIPTSALLNKSILDSIALPSGLDSIGTMAFKGCTRLAYMPLPTTITSIGSLAFAGCDKLVNINIPNVTYIADKAFTGCSSLKTITLSALSSMGTNVFSGCSSLTSISLPAGVKSIPDGTFSACSSLSTVAAPGVSSIGNEAFSACIKLSTYNFTNITSLGSAAFSGCSSLATVVLPDIAAIADHTFAGCSGLTTLTIPSTVATLSAYSFRNCTGLTSVTIPGSVTYIAPTAFEGCTGLLLTFGSGSKYFKDTDGVIYTSSARTCLVSCPASKTGSFTLPSSVIEIRPSAFEGCLNLTSVTLPAGLTVIPDSAFLDCAALTDIAMNSGIVSVGKWAFANCSKLVNVTLPSTVTTLGASAFENCSYLEKINIPSGVTVLSDRLFAKCSRLINFSIPEGVTTIGTSVFVGVYTGAGANLGNFVLPSTITSIATDAFKYAAINTITVKNPIPVIFSQSAVFNTISKTTPVYVPAGTVALYKAADQWKDFNFILEPSDLTIAVTPGELTNLLTTEQKIQVQKLTLTGTMDARDFQTMKTELIGIIDIDLSGVNIVAYTGTQGTGGTSNITYPADEIPVSAMGTNYKTIVLPTTIKTIGASAFNGCSLLTSLELPSTITSIGANAFYGCIRLANINIPSTVVSIGDAAFANCSTLPSISIPEGTATLGTSTFQNCINLTSVGLPSTITNIGAYAFMTCEKLKTILIYANVNSIGGYAFANCAGLDTVYAKPLTPIALGLNTGATPYVFYGKKSSCTLRVPENSKVAYVAANQWKDFGADNTIEEAWYGKKVIYSFTGAVPNVVRSTDGKVIASGTKVEEGTVISFKADYPANYVRTLKSTPIGKNIYTYYAPTSQTATSGTTDIPVNENLVFTLTIDSAAVWNGTNDNAWETADNWSSHYVPTRFDNVVINLGTNTTAAGNNSTCHNLTVNSGSVSVPAGKLLTVDGRITNNTTAAGIVVKADENGVLPNGTLIFQNPANAPFKATVEMYSKSTTDLTAAQGSKYNWQHFGIPVRSYNMSNPAMDAVFIREYNEGGTTVAKQWVMKDYEDVLSSFKGYEIAPNDNQPAGLKHLFTGELENRSYQSGLLPYTPGALNQGYNLLANPYTAAIDMSGINYGADMMQTVYLYSAGTYNSWNNWNTTEPKDTTNANTAGQYVAVPKALAGVGGLPSTIPSMQAFIVRATGNVSDSIGIPYVTSVIKNTELQRVRRATASPSAVCTKITVKGNSNKADVMWLFSDSNCSHSFDNGYDGEKMIGSVLSPQLYAVETSGKYQVDAVNDVNNTLLGFTAGTDSQYTLTFNHENTGILYGALFLIDMQNNTVTDITSNQSTYSFTSDASSPVNRFKIVSSAGNATSVNNPSEENISIFNSGRLIWISSNEIQNGTAEIYNTSGKRVKTVKLTTPLTSVQTEGSQGVYLVKILTGDNQSIVKKIVVNN